MKIEAIFGGILALVVIAVAVSMLLSVDFPGSGGVVSPPTNRPAPPGVIERVDLPCQCFENAFRLAEHYSVTSSQYRAGFELCRSQSNGGALAGEAWTAGWNARLSAKPYASSCRAWKNRRS